MKFSYTLIKKIIPEVKSKKQIVDALNYYAYEVEDLSGNVFDVKVPANRFSDAASHLGIAKELACILNLPFKYKFDFKFKKLKESDFKVEIKNKKLCLRYAALRLDNVNVEESPGWLQKILIECGLNPINNVVDIMNYVMLFLGEPMHAFDFDKLEGSKILIRNAKEGEKIITLDEKEIKLNENILVIADIKKPIAIAGIKGGKETGVDKNTKRILVEAANFEPANIYRTYKSLGLPTDAALRFSHRLSLNLPLLGLKLAEKLLREITKGRVTGFYDSLGGRVVNEQKDILFDLEKFNKFIGLEIKKDVAYEFLKKLGFKKVGNNIWSTPFLRLDIENSEDVFEEIARLYGYNFILPQTTSVKLLNTTLNEEIIWKEKIRKMLIGFSLNEASNYSFVSEKDLKENNFDLEQVFELINPISEEFRYLRPTLLINLKKIAINNLRFLETVGFFEFGNVFLQAKNQKEFKKLGIIIASKKENKFFELKGIIDEILKEMGIENFRYLEEKSVLKIKFKNEILGELKYLKEDFYFCFAELDFHKMLCFKKEEKVFKELPKFPLVSRDISFFVNRSFKVGEIIQSIYDLKIKFIENVDLIDEYLSLTNQNEQSLTLRIVLNPYDHTFTKEEIDKIISKILDVLVKKFNIKVR